MLKKMLLVLRIVLAVGLNIVLFLVIYQNVNSDYILSDTLFYLGIINLVYGLGSLFFVSKSSNSYINRTKAGPVNLALADQHIKKYHAGENERDNRLSLLSKYLRIAHIIFGVLLCISSVIVNII